MNFFEINLENIKEIKQKKNFAVLTDDLPEELTIVVSSNKDAAETILKDTLKEQKES
jgi:hypothetical protein